MYLYLYDSFLNNKKYSGLLAKIETRLTDLGIGGKIFRLSPLRNINELLTDEVRNGIKTVVVVGNDKSFTEVINFAAKLDVTLGIIPVGPNNRIAQALGVTSPEQATEILSARKVERVDLGKANGTYFLSTITVFGGEVTMECEEKFKIIPQSLDRVSICNLRPALAPNGPANYFNPQDGFLEILVQPIAQGMVNFFRKPTAKNRSIIPFKKLAILSRDSLPVVTDGQKVLKTPVRVEIAPKKLKVIVGKNRVF